MLKKILSTALLFLAVTSTAGGRAAGANASEANFALEAVGTGSIAEVSRRLFTAPVTVLGAEHREQAIKELPDEIRQNRITEGDLFRRVLAVMGPILKLHNKGEDVELFLYPGKAPRGMLVNGCLLVLSASLARPLSDAELSGVIAHELGHRYFMDSMLGAQKANDGAAMKSVELACDAVAMLSLSLIGQDPASYIRALKKIENIMKGKGYQVPLHGKSHPTVAERAQFARRLEGLLGPEQK